MNIKLGEIIARVIGIEKDGITEASSPETIGQWTSLKQLTLISTVESVFKVKFTLGEMRQLRNAGAFLEILKKKGEHDVQL
ncbi:acyl carrier protein [Paenibacillus polymyxa]|uniref:acyl carrier protein n=1 Tax=Paenibacillus polymyxa TaxID=1406 RepID=UPI003217CA56